MLAHLRANGVLLPRRRAGANRLAARARARKTTFEMLAAGCRFGARYAHGLLAVDPELRPPLRMAADYSESPAPSNIVALLDRLEYARGLKIDPARSGRIHAARLAG